MKIEYKKFDELTELITCGVAKRPDYVAEGYPFLSSKNVKKDRFLLEDYKYVSKEDFEKLTKNNKPEIGDILYTRVGSFGEAAVIDFDMDFAIFVSLTLIKVKKEILDSRYTMHYLNSPKIEHIAKNSTRGIGVQNLNVNTVRKYPIPLPPLQTQKKIVEVLDNAQELINLRKKQIELLDELIQSVFYDMFGDPVTNPKGWITYNVENVCKKIVGGGTPSKSKSEYYIGEIPWVTPKDMKTLNIVDSQDHINDLAIQNSSAKLIPSGSLLMVIRSGILKRYLPVALNSVEVAINQDMKAFLLDDTKVDKYFFLYFWIMAQRFILSKVRAVTADNIEFKQIKEMKMIAPPIELQNQFAQKVRKIQEQKELMQQSLTEMESNFNSLIQRAFKGELFN